MARYTQIDTSPRFLAVDLEAQLLPGTFEHALNHFRRQARRQAPEQEHSHRANEAAH